MEALRARSNISLRGLVEERSDSVSPPLTRVGLFAVAAAAAGWTAVVGALAVWRHDQFLSHRYDLGNMVQAVWSTAHGRVLEVTDGATGEQVLRLSGHVDPILVLFVPFWWVYPAPETLVVLQAAALASGLYPVVRMAQKHVASPAAVALLGAWYLVYPWVIWNALNDVHPVTLAIPLLLWAIWFLDNHRLGAFAIVGALALMAGELVGLTVAMLGVWYAVRYRRVRVGLGIAAVSAMWTIFCLSVLIPALNEGKPSRFYDRFETVGGSPAGLARTLLTDPTAVLSAISTEPDLTYLAYVLIPTALLALGTPLLAAAVLPQIAVNLLSEFPPTTEPVFQYITPVIAPLVAATIMALNRVPRHLRVPVAAAPLAASAILLIMRPPIPGTHDFVFAKQDSPARVAAMAEAVDRIPNDVAVMTTNRLGAHLSARRRVSLISESTFADWAVIDTWDRAVDELELPVSEFKALIAELERNRAWDLVYAQQGILVFQRRP